jgi:hypothetical protein
VNRDPLYRGNIKYNKHAKHGNICLYLFSKFVMTQSILVSVVTIVISFSPLHHFQDFLIFLLFDISMNMKLCISHHLAVLGF